MARTFSLGGLLRLRQLEQDQAAGNLAAANASRRESEARENAARVGLNASMTTPGTLSALQGIAAARASSRSMVSELAAVTAERERRAAEAQQEYSAARMQTVSLEKLAVRHAQTQAYEELQTEQIALDEIAGNAWQREAQRTAHSTNQKAQR